MAVKNVFMILVLGCLLANAAAAMDLPIEPGYKVASTFQVSGAQAGCIKSLADMNSCTKDVVGFLLKTQDNLGPGCCPAISTITNDCWPSTLEEFGFTQEIHSALKGHCGLASSPAAAPLSGSYPPLPN